MYCTYIALKLRYTMINKNSRDSSDSHMQTTQQDIWVPDERQ